MNRLQVAMKYNVKENETLLAQGRRKIPVVQIRRGKSVQTGFSPTATFSSFQQVIQGPSAATLYRILDILNDGYGSIDTTNLYFSIEKQLFEVYQRAFNLHALVSSDIMLDLKIFSK